MGPSPDNSVNAGTSAQRAAFGSSFLQVAKRPELGAISGLLIVTVFFLFTADSAMFTVAGMMNVMSPAAQLGILAVGAALLMIAGEFDLSIGSMVAFAGFVFGACMLAGPPLFSALVQASGGYALGFGFCVATALLGAALVRGAGAGARA